MIEVPAEHFLKPALIAASTVAELVSDGVVSVDSSEEGHLVIGSVAALPENVRRAYERVDLAVGQQRVFLVEHAAAACALFGALTADVRSLVDRFDLERPSHAAASAGGFLPSDTFGSASGRIWQNVGGWPLRYATQISMWSVSSPVSIKSVVIGPDSAPHSSRVSLTPPSGEVITIKCSVEKLSLTARYDPTAGVTDPELRGAIAAARSIAVKPAFRWDEESVLHAVGDVIGDMIGIGHLFADIDIELGYYYHAVTHSLVDRLLRGDANPVEIPCPA